MDDEVLDGELVLISEYNLDKELFIFPYENPSITFLTWGSSK